jgi:hypothetical protein
MMPTYRLVGVPPKATVLGILLPQYGQCYVDVAMFGVALVCDEHVAQTFRLVRW